MRTHRHDIQRALAAASLIALLSAPAGAATSTAGASKSSGTKAAPAHSAMVMPWIEDNYAKAISEGKARKLPIFVESWAPW